MILPLIQLLKQWRFTGIGPLDLIHWNARRIELSYDWRKLCVEGPEPFVPRDSAFGRQVAAICKPTYQAVTDADIIDRFISHGKLWLVMRNGKVVTDVRLSRYTCRNCKSIPKDGCERTLYTWQGGYCIPCFGSFLSEDERIEYTLKTCKRSIVCTGRITHYDPVSGLARSFSVPY